MEKTTMEPNVMVQEQLLMTQSVDDGFRVITDKGAEWCIKKIREAKQEAQKWVDYYGAQMEKAKKEANDAEAYFTFLLREYFETVPHKNTKTQQSYSLPSGKLLLKKQQPKFDTDDTLLIPWLKKNAMNEFVKVKETADWATLKKQVTVTPDGVSVVDENGEIIPGVTVTQRDDAFLVDVY